MKKIFLLLTLILIGSCNKEDSITIKQDMKYIEGSTPPKIIKPKKKRFKWFKRKKCKTVKSSEPNAQ